MAATIMGLGTAVPAHTMSEEQAREMAAEICCDNQRDARRLGVMYRKSGVKKRHTVVPYKTAFTWLPGDTSGGTEPPTGPSTAERMKLYSE
ncbi:MAG: hypothetical protein N2C12_12580, partial [Planctomycetales bacterium]